MSFTLQVRSPERDSIELNVRADETVGSLAAGYSSKHGPTGLDPSRAQVCFRGRVLPQEATLASAGVTSQHFVVICFPRGPALTRVCCGKGWVVHGLVFEYADGVRTGYFGENDGSPMTLSDDAGLARRGGRWHALQPGERLIGVKGRHSTMGYLCGEVVLHLSAGRSIEFKGDNANVFGDTFSHVAPFQLCSVLQLGTTFSSAIYLSKNKKVCKSIPKP